MGGLVSFWRETFFVTEKECNKFLQKFNEIAKDSTNVDLKCKRVKDWGIVGQQSSKKRRNKSCGKFVFASFVGSHFELGSI